MKNISHQINAAIRSLGLRVVAARRGNTYLDYSYFISLATGSQVGDSVMVARQAQLSIPQWIQYASHALQEQAKHDGTLVPPTAVPLKLRVVDEMDHGVPTGMKGWRVESIDADKWASVLGRSTGSVDDAVADWNRRAKADGHNVLGKLLADFTNPLSVDDDRDYHGNGTYTNGIAND